MLIKQKYFLQDKKTGISFSSGSIAKKSNSSFTIQLGETIVFVSVVIDSLVKENQSFLPLNVDYRERFFAAGRFPGGFFKREGRPTEKEILISRLADRSIRPLFPSNFFNEIQINGILLSADLINQPDILMVNGVSAALMCSDIPFNGPIGCVRIGQIEDKLIVNPTNEEIKQSTLDLIYVGSEKETIMIEGSANEIEEDKFISYLKFAHDSIQSIIESQKKLQIDILGSKKVFSYANSFPNKDIFNICKQELFDEIKNYIVNKNIIIENELKSKVYNTLINSSNFNNVDIKANIDFSFKELEKIASREYIINNNKRLDNRLFSEIRTINSEVNYLPCVHGSSLFSRGDTQTLAVVTLGTEKDMQDLDAISGESLTSKSFILHYNFPSFSVGEVGKSSFISRREIGHGSLAERSIFPLIPKNQEFPYSIRIVSEIMSSNGSTSMATVCASSLALMDAGVPIKKIVAGISIGLLKNLNNYILLTDITGEEDHFGDMDFKIAGTEKGITGFQLDLKVNGIDFNILKNSIYEAKIARLKIINYMSLIINKPNTNLKKQVPKIYTININPDKIGSLIGPKGKNIKSIIEITGANIEISKENDGKVFISAKNSEIAEKAIKAIESYTKNIDIGSIYNGNITSIKDFGLFVECLPGKEGLLHKSEIKNYKNKTSLENLFKIGDLIKVKCIGIDNKGKIKLTNIE